MPDRRIGADIARSAHDLSQAVGRNATVLCQHTATLVVLEDNSHGTAELRMLPLLGGSRSMWRLQEMIEELSKRATDSDLIALLATSRDARIYNGVLARELHDVVRALRLELEQRQLVLPLMNEIELVSPKH